MSEGLDILSGIGEDAHEVVWGRATFVVVEFGERRFFPRSILRKLFYMRINTASTPRMHILGRIQSLFQPQRR